MGDHDICAVDDPDDPSCVRRCNTKYVGQILILLETPLPLTILFILPIILWPKWRCRTGDVHK
jgi:hypothetical protein